MRVFSEAATLAKNALSSDDPFLVFVEIYNESVGGYIRLVRNTENITWRDVEWTAYPLGLETSSEDGKTIPTINMTVSNVGGLIQTFLQRYNGLTDSKVVISVALASNLSNPAAEFELNYTVSSTKYDEEWVTFSLSASPELYNRFPRDRYINNFCPYKCHDIRCGYTGEGSCSNTLESCLMVERFGGEPGIQRGA